MPENNFDIYQTESGYTAVTNDVRRTILEALAGKECGLPDLVKITGKAKPTLSSVHMKELLSQGLVEELPHPTDNRKKIYRLRARRIGSSTVPVEQLRSAVKHYASLSPASTQVPLAAVFDALSAAEPETPTASLRAQAMRLGELAAGVYAPADGTNPVSGMATFLELEGLCRPLRLDLEHHVLELEPTPGLAAVGGPERVAALVAGFVDGILRKKGMTSGPLELQPKERSARFALRLTPMKK